MHIPQIPCFVVLECIHAVYHSGLNWLIECLSFSGLSFSATAVVVAVAADGLKPD